MCGIIVSITGREEGIGSCSARVLGNLGKET